MISLGRSLCFRLASIALLLASAGATHAADSDKSVDALLAQARAAEARSDPATALALYRQADALKPNDAAILHGLSKQLSDASDDLKDSAARKKQVEEALAYSQRAVALAPKDPANVLSLAVCYGKLAGVADNATRVECSRRVKEYAEQALALDPNYAWAHHVLGRWNYEVSQIGGPTRLAARVLYGALPPASAGEAVKHLERAVELDPDCPSHHVELGFAYLSSGDRKRALEQFREGLALPAREKHDELSHRRARAELARFEK